MRDNFPTKTKEMLAKRVAFLCSNPVCNMQTVGPQLTPSGVINVGVAAHITAASLGGPRYDTNLNDVSRSDIQNGIWLCQSCAKLVDSDVNSYTKESLRLWKKNAEINAGNRLNKQISHLPETQWELKGPGGDGILESGYNEKQLIGYKIRYFLQDNKLHLEQELENGSIGYYVIDSNGNVIDQTFPYPLSEYSVEIDPSLVLRTDTQSLPNGTTRETISMKWGKKVVLVWDADRLLSEIHAENGLRMDNVRKVFVFEAPEFKRYIPN